MPVKKLLLALAALIASATPATALESNADYTHTPIYMSNDITPNVIIMMDNSGSMNQMAYTGNYDPATDYYGYFSSDLTYSYASGKFSIDASGDWSGNFLNWAAMRRVDVGRKVMMGGLATSRTGGGNQTNYGESPSGWFESKQGQDSDSSSLAPYVGAKYYYVLESGYLKIWNGDTETYDATYTIAVQKDSSQEPDDFVDGNLAGVMQKVSDKARWGLAFFNDGQGSSEGCSGGGCYDGGYISQDITGTGYGTNFITDFQNTAANTTTPLAETLYQVAGYYAQNSTIRYRNGNYSTGVQGKDPFYFDTYADYVTCPKNFVIIITDGGPMYDSNIPTSDPISAQNLTDMDGDSDPTPTSDDNYTSDYLDDVALWAHTTDLRSDIDNSQTLTIYTVFAFGDDATAEQLLKDTAKNGAFTDTNDNNLPDVDAEWDEDGDGVPDTYFQASNGASLETELMAAISDILQRATSGTALSVLATSASGAGNVYQAYFLPQQTFVESSGSRDIEWVGHMMELNIDSYGHLRDSSDTCIAFNFDTDNNETMVQALTEDTDGICTTTVSSETSLSDWTGYNWDAGVELASTAYTSRNVYTLLDADEDGLADGGEVVLLSSLASSNISYISASTTADAEDTVNFVLGEARSGLRDRTDGDGNEWKLGDIIHSTPTVVGTPQEAYGLLYQDATYTTFYATQKDRNTRVYVGANDGMLHAFSDTGAEKWGFVPYNLLPHLRWLKSSSYSHVYYMDAKTKATDVQVFTCDSDHTGQHSVSGKCWGTVLLAGMRMGGGSITDDGYDVDGDGGSPASKLRNYRSSYVALDVTDGTATAPDVMWEFGHNLAGRYPSLASSGEELGFSLSYPAVVKMGPTWIMVVGSGPDVGYVPDYNGDSTQTAKLFAIDIADGSLLGAVAVNDNNSSFADPIAVDLDFSTSNTTTTSSQATFNSEVVYIGETYESGSAYRGRVWRVVTDESENPQDWDVSLLFTTNSGEAISSAPAVATDDQNNVWIYFGTGRYYSDADKSDTQSQTFYGIKDPCWDDTNATWDTTCLADSSKIGDSTYNNPSVDNNTTDLINATSATISTDGTVTGVSGGGGAAPSNWGELVALANGAKGWYMTFPDAGERNLNKPTVIGGLVLFTSFIPSTDVCGYGGDSYFYAVYYKTGTAFNTSTIGTSGTEILRRSEESSTGMGSAVAIHSGRESGGKAYVQYSTGEAKGVEYTPAESNKSKIISWREVQ